MSDEKPPWQALYDRVRVTRDGSRVYVPPATDAELDALEREVGSPLPASYRAWMRRFGPGEIHDWVCLSLVAPGPGSVLQATRHLREISEYHSSLAWLAGLLSFGGSGGGDIYAWDPDAITRRSPREYRFYFLRRDDGFTAHDAGESFCEFIEWIEADLDRWMDWEGIEPGLAFSPAVVREKAKPPRSAVKPWLAHDGDSVRKVALGLRADPRPADFGVLADALTEAGCDHADLLASCWPDAHPEDHAWALDMLLGKPK